MRSLGLSTLPRCNGYTKSCPIEKRARITFASRRNVRMPGNVTSWISPSQTPQQLLQRRVLALVERLRVTSFQFDSKRKIVATFAPAPFRHSSVPSAAICRYELNQLTVTADEKMRRHPQMIDTRIVRVRRRVEPVREKLDHAGSSKLIWRQADSVYHNQADALAFWAGVEIGRIDPLYPPQPAPHPVTHLMSAHPI